MLNLHDNRDDSGQMLSGTVVAMVIVGLIFAGALATLSFTFRLATAQPDNDEGIQARAELAELFASVDSIEECASPTRGTAAAYSDTCFRRELIAGASLIAVLPDELSSAAPLYDFDHDSDPNTDPLEIGYAACWLTANPDPSMDERQRRCLLLEGDSDELECVNPPSGPCLTVLSQVTRNQVKVDNHGGGRLLLRSWDEESPDDCHVRLNPPPSPTRPPEDPDVPFLPLSDCFVLGADSDRLIYTDVEWWCLRWRHPHALDAVTPAYSWRGDCPEPHDPEGEWTATNPPYPLPVAAVAGLVDTATTTLADPHTVSDQDRIAGVEIVVCVASTREERIQGAAHCSIDRMRFTVA